MEDTRKSQERYIKLDFQPNKCYALCSKMDIVDKLVFIKKEANTLYSGAIKTKEYEVDIIYFKKRGFHRETGYINWLSMETYNYVLEIDAQRFFRLDKQIGIINALINALQADILNNIQDGTT